MPKSDLQKLFSTPHLIDIIIVSQDNGNLGEMMRKIGLKSYKQIYSALDKLLELKIVCEEFLRKGGLQRKIHLTEKGEVVLKQLEELATMIRSVK